MARGPDDRGSEIPPERIPITVRLRPRDIREISDIPDGSKVQISFLPFGYKQPEAKDMTQEGDEYVYHSEVPPGHFYYSFKIYLPGGIQYYPKSVDLEEDISPGQAGTRVSQGVSFTVEKPADDRDYDEGNGEEDEPRASSARRRVWEAIGGIASSAEGKVIDITGRIKHKFKPAPAVKLGSHHRIGKEDVAEEYSGAKVETGETDETRQQMVASLQETFGNLFRSTVPLVSQKPSDAQDRHKKAPGRDALGKFHKELKNVAERMAEIPDSRNEDVRALLKGDLYGIVSEEHNQWIQTRSDLSPSARNELATPNGRLRFRIKTFNELCNQKKLGLKSKNKIRAGKDEDGFLEYAHKKLGRNWRAFDRVCSSYDGGNVGRALLDASRDTMEESVKVDNFDIQGKARNRLFRKVTGRLRQDTKDIYTLNMKRWGKWARALEEVGDIGLKAGAITLLAMSGIGYFTVPAAGILWSLRGISESLGYDFGSVLAKGASYPYRLASAGVRRVGKLPPAPVAIPRASLSATDRIKLFFRGASPVVPALTYLPKVGEKIEKVVPGSNLEPGETAMEENENTAKDVEAACKRILGEGGGGYPPAPAPHPPEPSPAPAVPTPATHPAPATSTPPPAAPSLETTPAPSATGAPPINVHVHWHGYPPSGQPPPAPEHGPTPETPVPGGYPPKANH